MSKAEKTQEEIWEDEDAQRHKLEEMRRISVVYEVANMRVDELRKYCYDDIMESTYHQKKKSIKKQWKKLFSDHSVEEIEQLEGVLLDAFYKNKFDPRNRPSRNLDLFTNIYNQSFLTHLKEST